MTACRWPDKVKHPTKAAALAAIRALDQAGRGVPDMAAYPCPGSKPTHWHVGHDVRRFTQRIRRVLRSGGSNSSPRSRRNRR